MSATPLEEAGQRIADELLFTADLALVLFEHSPDATLIVDVEGRICAANRQAVLLTARPMSELLGLSVDSLLPEQVRAHHASHRAGFLDDPRVRPMGIGLDLRLCRRGGDDVPVDINLAPVVLQQGLYVIATVRRRRS